MKRVLALILAVLMAATLFVACSKKEAEEPTEASTEIATEAPEDDVIDYSDVSLGVCIYKYDDTFMTGVRDTMEAYAGELGVAFDVNDSQNSQPTQNDQVQAFITKGVSALCINPVDNTAAQPLIDSAKAADLPIVLFNRQPSDEIMATYEKAYYVGAHAEESGTFSGQIIADYWTANKAAADKNADDTLQYVMLQGEPGHQDATLRTEYSVKAIEEAGIKVEKLEEDTATWDKAKATDKMDGWFAKHGDKIEAVLANNDDMALGAIESLKANGYFADDKFIPVVGVDATAPALEAMKEGTLLGTVLNDGVGQGKATVAIAVKAAKGESIDSDNVGYPIEGNFSWIPYVKVTQDNYQEFM